MYVLIVVFMAELSPFADFTGGQLAILLRDIDSGMCYSPNGSFSC